MTQNKYSLLRVMEAWQGKVESDQDLNPVALIANSEAQCLTSGTHGRITWVSNGLLRPGPPAPWPTEHTASPMSQLQSMYAICYNQHTIVTAFPISWGLRSNLNFIFTASCGDFSGCPCRYSTHSLTSKTPRKHSMRSPDSLNPASFMPTN